MRSLGAGGMGVTENRGLGAAGVSRGGRGGGSRGPADLGAGCLGTCGRGLWGLKAFEGPGGDGVPRAGV